MDVRLIASVSMWLVAWSTMLGGFAIGFSLPRDHRSDVRLELQTTWETAHVDDTTQSSNDSKEHAPKKDAPRFSISEAKLTKAVEASEEYESVNAFARVAMISGAFGTLFFVVLVIAAGVSELKQKTAEPSVPTDDEAATPPDATPPIEPTQT